MKLRVVVNWAPYPIGTSRLAHQIYAAEKLHELEPDWCEVFYARLPGEEAAPAPWNVVKLDREASSVTGGRRLPYMKEMFDVAVQGLPDDAWGGFFNSDIIVTPGFFQAVQEASEASQEVIICHRTDIRKADVAPEDGQKVNQRTCTDGYFLRAGIWRKWREAIPDFVMGEPWWDTGMIWWAKYRGLAQVHLGDHEILHLVHRRYWRRASDGAKYNSRLGRNLLKGKVL